MEFKTVKKNIKNKKFDPVYFFFGDEEYLIDTLIRHLKKEVVDPQTKDFNFDFLYSDEISGQDIINLARSLPMMTDYRLVIIKSIQKLSVSDKKLLTKYLESPVESTILVLTANRVDRRRKFYKHLVAKSIWVECKPVYEDIAVKWIIKRFKEQQITISRSAAFMMVQLAGTSLASLDNEIEKIITYIDGKDSVDQKVVSDVVGFYKTFNIWDLTDAIGTKNNTLAYQILVHFFEEGVSLPLLIIELTRRILLLTKIRLMLNKGIHKQTIRKSLGLKNYFLNLYLTQTKNFSLAELKKGLQALQQADRQLKTGYLKPEMVLTLIVHDLVSLKTDNRFYN